MWDLWAINKPNLEQTNIFYMQHLMHYSFLAEQKITTDQNHVSFLTKEQASKAELQKRKSLIC